MISLTRKDIMRQCECAAQSIYCYEVVTQAELFPIIVCQKCLMYQIRDNPVLVREVQVKW